MDLKNIVENIVVGINKNSEMAKKNNEKIVCDR